MAKEKRQSVYAGLACMEREVARAYGSMGFWRFARDSKKRAYHFGNLARRKK